MKNLTTNTESIVAKLLSIGCYDMRRNETEHIIYLDGEKLFPMFGIINTFKYQKVMAELESVDCYFRFDLDNNIFKVEGLATETLKDVLDLINLRVNLFLLNN